MHATPSTSLRGGWRHVAGALALALPLGTAAEPGDDALLSLLRERGLVEITASEIAAPGPAPAEPVVRGPAVELVVAALNFIDTPYRRGGNSAETGFDCSGFTRHVFATSLGVELPRRADEQAHADTLHRVDRSELLPGDLVFFNTLRRAFSHVGIYIGEGRFVHAPRTGAQVRVEDMRSSYWSRRFDGARRAQAGRQDPAPDSR